MPPELERIREMFEGAEWTRVVLNESVVLQQAFATSYATVGILLAEGVEQVLATWERAQDELRELKSSNPRFETTTRIS